MPEWSVWERMKEHECIHENVKPTKAQKNNGVVCVYLQCVDCGERTKEARKAEYDVDRLPWFDENFRERQRKRNAAILEKLRSQWEAERKAEMTAKDSEWWVAYNEYLRSAHWAQVRRRVLVRDGFRCQNCFGKVTDTTAHVHHLSYTGYSRLGKSFAFECVTLCRDCHKEFHDEPESTFEEIVIPF